MFENSGLVFIEVQPADYRPLQALVLVRLIQVELAVVD
jgi:hypothetical protein